MKHVKVVKTAKLPFYTIVPTNMTRCYIFISSYILDLIIKIATWSVTVMDQVIEQN